MPMVGMAATPDGRGYWTVASDGGVFCFGTAAFLGSTGGQPLQALVAGIVPTASGAGYWLWGQDGSVHAFGDAVALGGYPDLLVQAPALTSDGVDAFFGLSTTASGYMLWAVSPLGPPPTVQRYVFAPPPSLA
jgi:hypothetical protein